GNQLIVRDDIFEEFCNRTKDIEYAEDLYVYWFERAWKIIEKNNNGKRSVTTRTPDELALLRINSPEHFFKDLYDESDSVKINRKLIHGDEIPKGTLEIREDTFSDKRSYMSEIWYSEGSTYVTYYFPADDLLAGHIPNSSRHIERYLISQDKLSWNETHHMGIEVIKRNGIKLYSVTVALACEDEQYCNATL
ncbi:MAG: hypothetical protein ACI4M9_09445, partial [Succinivibrio sp.]